MNEHKTRSMKINRKQNRWILLLSVFLAVGQVAVVMLSWLIASLWPQVGVRSLLSSEGIRWFFGNFTENIACAPVVWLLLLSIGWGAFVRSGLRRSVGRTLSCSHRTTETSTQKDGSLTYREHFALIVVAIEALLTIAVMLLLTCIPHAVLLNIEGGLSSGAFPDSIIPVIAFTMTLMGLTYGSLCGKLNSLSDYGEALSFGIRLTAAWWPPVILTVQFWASLLFVFA